MVSTSLFILALHMLGKTNFLEIYALTIFLCCSPLLQGVVSTEKLGNRASSKRILRFQIVLYRVTVVVSVILAH